MPPPGSGTLTPNELNQLSSGWRVRKMTAQKIHFVKPPPISGLDALLISQISFYDDPARFTDAVNVFVRNLSSG